MTAIGARRVRRAVLVLLLPVVVAFGLVGTTMPRAQALSGSEFRPGNIIADSVFFDSGTMGPADVQAFLESKVPVCSTGFTCLRDFRQDTTTRGTDAQCTTYQGAVGERASTIISKVAQACGINPRVLLVLLQKETSLISKTNPTWDNAYKKATGYGCPDTAPCDAQYYGFFNQVYKAAWQYKRYSNNPDNYAYRPGRVNYIQWSPNAACGGSNVYIENRATAALYIYTPYQPNQIALDKLYGTGDSCSAYGNRNFWRIFTDWFGSAQFAVVGDMFDRWTSLGGPNSPLGVPVAPQYPTPDGGWAQPFSNGRMHWFFGVRAHAVVGAISRTYDSLGGGPGVLGYPVTDEMRTARKDGYFTAFQNGAIFYSNATGAHAVIGDIAQAWERTGNETGPLGYPSTDRVPTTDGTGHFTAFQNGAIFTSPATGAHAVVGDVARTWERTGNETGPLGWPTVDSRPTGRGDGSFTTFQRGAIFSNATTGTHAVIGDIAQAWERNGNELGPLGWPITDRNRTTRGDGYYTAFQNGAVFTSPATGAHAVLTDIAAAWQRTGNERGPLGFPTADRKPTAGNSGWYSSFQNGAIFTSPATGAHAVVGDIARAWERNGNELGVLGWPTTDRNPTARGDGYYTAFQNGAVFTSPATGAHAVVGEMARAWERLGNEVGPLGYPTADRKPTARGDGWYQLFQNGILFSNATHGTHAVIGSTQTAYAANGNELGALGWPTSDRQRAAAGDGWRTEFQNGAIVSGTATGAHAVIGDIAGVWRASGAEAGPLGYPLTDRLPTTRRDGTFTAFQGGAVFSSPATGAHAVVGPVAAAWERTGNETGPLGFPTRDAYTDADGNQRVDFQGGRIVLKADGTTTVTVGR